MIEDVLKKLDEYRIFNYILPGAVFAFFGSKLTSAQFLQADIFAAFFLYYFLGMTISRIGSALEAVLVKLRLIKLAPYEEYCRASKVDAKIDKLNGERNTFRTLAALPLVLGLLAGYMAICERCGVSVEAQAAGGLCGLFILYGFATIQRTKYVRNRVGFQQPKEDAS